ncbi:hypothetical protein [Rhizobium leguminosarum]|uniref:hypothetical protein n=1 Tax=Rhizobium leguminosarum TaxID=384 RepID=UPI001C95CA1F|nr:hypothetical protein [Rhizobium leguminosarum]MBY5624900.1 hypothetical protein [Rhizobium leguminosarum]
MNPINLPQSSLSVLGAVLSMPLQELGMRSLMRTAPIMSSVLRNPYLWNYRVPPARTALPAETSPAMIEASRLPMEHSETVTVAAAAPRFKALAI